MLRHEAGTRLGEDIEELHDMRVATRRMRAAFDIFGEAFKPKVLNNRMQGLRATGRALGRVRDLDVFLEKAHRYLEGLPEGDRQGLRPILQLWEGERAAARDQMVLYLDSSDYLAFKQKFYAFVSTPGAGVLSTSQRQLVRVIAPVLIFTRMAAVRAFASLLPSASLEQLHELRIEFKKLRYTFEFFREVLGAEIKAVIGDLKGLQDHLGDLNDAQVATQILSQFLTDWDARQAGLPIGERQNPEPVVAYLAYQHAERHRLMTTFGEAWACFDRLEFKRNLALAVSVL
jgi:CHAD domain-containing protein